MASHTRETLRAAECRVAVFAPTALDAEIAGRVLNEERIDMLLCASLAELFRAIEGGLGAVVMPEEVLTSTNMEELLKVLANQPPWSALPFIILTRPSRNARPAIRLDARLANALLIERPVRIEHLLSAIRTSIEARRRQYAIRDLLREALEADRKKDEFLAVLAHELRNPLAPIRNATQLLKAPRTDAGVREWATNIVERQVQTMAWLLDDLLDLSRITRGKLTLHKQRVKLPSIIENAIEIARPLIDARQHVLEVYQPQEAVELDADPLRLTQVVSNLLTNAAKYTDRGGRIELNASIEGSSLRLAVRDSGIGLAPESLKGLFEMFSQVKTALARSEGGLGIGLALVKGLTELHGGSVEAKSEGLGRGSEFVVRIPLPQVALAMLEAAPTERSKRPIVSRRVVLADDNVDGAKSLAMLLEMQGHEVHLAHDGAAALEALERWRPEFAILDIGMPRLTGYEVAQRTRAAKWGRELPLIALTGWGQAEDQRRAKEAGFNHHLTKPVDHAALQALLAEPTSVPRSGTD
jgi:signal transduction histidine kinase/ActR/RegA family two-component response regulator